MYGRSTAAPQVRTIVPTRPGLSFLFQREFLLALTVCLRRQCDALSRKLKTQRAPKSAPTPAKEPEHATDWTHWVRIGAFGLRSDAQADDIVRKATDSNVFGIEVDNDIPGRYESFLDPTAKLKAIHAVAEAAHKVGNRAFVYIAGTECITANADKAPHSVMKDHPDWVQRKITGEPASFTGGAAFWIRKGDEDVWISPYAEPWRKTYMERVRQIAATGIDGIYVDIPYWMTHFDGWEKTWASFDDFTVAAFKKKTGLDAKKDVKIGDFRTRTSASGSISASTRSPTSWPRFAQTLAASSPTSWSFPKFIRASRKKPPASAPTSTRCMRSPTPSPTNTNSAPASTWLPAARKSIGSSIRPAC